MLYWKNGSLTANHVQIITFSEKKDQDNGHFARKCPQRFQKVKLPTRILFSNNTSLVYF